MQRAVHAIPHILKLQNEGPAIDRMYKKGLLTDDKMGEIKEMKAFVEQEFTDVQAEADELLDGWGRDIWPQAMKFHTVVHERLNGKETDDAVDGSTPEEKKVQNKPVIDPKLKGKSEEEIAEHYAKQLLKEEAEEAKKKSKKAQGKK